MKPVRAMKTSLKDYCKKTDLMGMSYIWNEKIHLSERIFWTICLILAAGCSYRLVRNYQQTFESNVIGFVIENTGIWDKINFTSIGICEKSDTFNEAAYIEYLQSKIYKNNETIDPDIVDFVQIMVYSKMYLNDFVEMHCGYKEGCSDCVQCPQTGYREMADELVRKCSEIMLNCSWNGVPFECCNYFLPLSTPSGTCFVFNSLHTTTKNSTHWFQAEVGIEDGDGEMVLHLNTSVFLHLMNEEDVPSYLFLDNVFNIWSRKFKEFELYVQDMINDPEIREISPKNRKCRFPDEKPENFAYDFYSLSACEADCLKRNQFKKCGCAIHHLHIKSDDKIPSCDYNGMKCLVESNLFILHGELLNPWSTDEMKCECLLSCNEKDHNVFSEYSHGDIQKTGVYQVSIIQRRSSELFRRQAIRSRLDIFVIIGGIFGLFMGASIISIVEIFYFICIRTINSLT